MRRERLEGPGLHSGALATVTLGVTSEPEEISFRRVDLAPEQRFVARLEPRLENVEIGPRRTQLRSAAGQLLSTVEHALAAAAGMGRWGICWRVSGPELPILDGSAAPYCELLEGTTGLAERARPRPWRVARAFAWQHASGARYRLEPSGRGRVVATSDFEHPAIGRQRVEWTVGDVEAFRSEIAPARTFGFVDELEALREAGLIRGGTPDCALVFDREGPLSEPRFGDEPGRHKLLDLIGDLALLGAPLAGLCEAERPSHAATVEFLHAAIDAGALQR